MASLLNIYKVWNGAFVLKMLSRRANIAAVSFQFGKCLSRDAEVIIRDDKRTLIMKR